MNTLSPEWRPMADDEVWIPEADGSGTIIAVVAPTAARRDTWATGLVVRIADAWAAHGHRVVLAEGEIEYPQLHRDLGMPNDEGLVDAAIFGASITRVARPVPEHAFFFVSAGTPAGDVGGVARVPRVGRIFRAFKEAGATLVVFVREGGAGFDDFVRAADDVVVLQERDTPTSRLLERAAEKVRWVTGPGPDPEPPSDDAIEVTTAVTPEASGVPQDQGVEPVMDFSSDASDGTAVESEQALGGVLDPATEKREGGPLGLPDEGWQHEDQSTAPPSTAQEVSVSRRTTTGSRKAGADPHASRKLTWVLLGLLVLAILVLLGALR